MYEENIQPLWEEWFKECRPDKRKMIRNDMPWLITFWVIYVIGTMVGIILENGYIMLISVIAFIVLCVISTINCTAGNKNLSSCIEFCWRKGIYDVEANPNGYFFMPSGEQRAFAGKAFHYEVATVVLFDTPYTSEEYNIGVLVEITPNEESGSGKIKWKKDHIEISDTLHLDERIVLCIEKLMEMESHHAFFLQCYQNGNAFYLYITDAAIGLLIDDFGELYIKDTTIWRNADRIVEIMDSCLGERR